MSTRRARTRRLRAAAAAGLFLAGGPLLVSGPGALAQPDTASPIQHVIVVIGENHSFDNVYGAYTPEPGQSIDNLLSKGIVNADGSPGPNVALAVQHTASDTVTYSLDPSRTGAYDPLPQPNTTSPIGQPPNVPDPRANDDGHPAYSTLSQFEGFTERASSRRSRTSRSSGRTRPSSSPSMKAGVTTTAATWRRSPSSATAPGSR